MVYLLQHYVPKSNETFIDIPEIVPTPIVLFKLKNIFLGPLDIFIESTLILKKSEKYVATDSR